MKKINFIFLFMLTLWGYSLCVAQQFNGNNNPTDDIDRMGKVAIGIGSATSNAYLHVTNPQFLTSSTAATPSAEFNGLVKIGDMGLPTRVNIDVAFGNYSTTSSATSSANTWGATYLGFNGLRDRDPNNYTSNAGSWEFKTDGGSNGGFVMLADAYGRMYFIPKQSPNIIGSSGGNLDETYDDQQLLEKTSMYINHDGKVMVGSVDCDINDNYLLYVQKGIKTEEVKVKSGWCDYVFDKDYPLLSLDKVAEHIEQKGYLHRTPSASEIEAEGGIKLKATALQQQEKIEEIYLHLIELNDRLKSVEAENAALKNQIKELNCANH